MAEVIARRDPGFTLARLIWALLWIVEAILGLRFILRLIAANPAAGFTDFIYRLSRPLVDPFVNVVRNTATGNSTGGVIEWFTLIAMIVYWLAAWAIARLVTFNSVDRTIDYTDRIEPV